MKTLATTALVLITAAASSSADAGELGFYIGGYYGRVSKQSSLRSFEEFATEIDGFFGFTPTVSSNSFEDTDNSFALIAGYRLAPYLAFEGAYTNLGQVIYKREEHR